MLWTYGHVADVIGTVAWYLRIELKEAEFDPDYDDIGHMLVLAIRLTATTLIDLESPLRTLRLGYELLSSKDIDNFIASASDQECIDDVRTFVRRERAKDARKYCARGRVREGFNRARFSFGSGGAFARTATSKRPWRRSPSSRSCPFPAPTGTGSS